MKWSPARLSYTWSGTWSSDYVTGNTTKQWRTETLLTVSRRLPTIPPPRTGRVWPVLTLSSVWLMLTSILLYLWGSAIVTQVSLWWLLRNIFCCAKFTCARHYSFFCWRDCFQGDFCTSAVKQRKAYLAYQAGSELIRAWQLTGSWKFSNFSKSKSQRIIESRLLNKTDWNEPRFNLGNHNIN